MAIAYLSIWQRCEPARGVPPRCSGLWPESTGWLLIVTERRIQFAVAQTPGAEPSESNTPTASVAVQTAPSSIQSTHHALFEVAHKLGSRRPGSSRVLELGQSR